MKKVLVVGLLPCMLAMQANAADMIVRLRALSVTPDESSTKTLNDINTKVSTEVIPELDFTYMITPTVGAELILGTSKHDLKTNLGDIGDVGVLPPTLMVQYRPAITGKYHPYAGVGVNYTRFYENDLHVGATPVEIKKNSVGPAAQMGVDIDLTPNYFMNIDVKRVGLKTDATLGGTDIGTLKINPWLFGVGIGRKFSF